MNPHTPDRQARRRFYRRAAAAVALLLGVAVTWLLAHEGHAPLPSRGVDTKELAQGRLVISREARQALDIQTAQVESRPVVESLLAYATLATPWRQHAFASSRLPGRVVKLLARPGEVVAGGQTLAEVESMDLETLQLEILNAANDIRLSEQVVKNLEQAGGAVPGQQVIDAQSRHRQNVNALEVARSKWLSLGLSPADFDKLLKEKKPAVRSLPVRSPVAGTVIHADLVVGKVVEPLEHLLEVIDLSQVWVKVGVLEKDLHRVEVGQPVELRLTAYPGEDFKTTISIQGCDLDPQTHLNTVWATLTNSTGAEPRFLPGMAGEADLLLPATATTAVPEEALLRSGADSFVLVEETAAAGGSQYQRKNVVVGRRAGGWVEVRSPELFPGDRVVTRGGHELASFFIQGVLRPSPEAVRSILDKMGVPQDVKELTEPVEAHVVEDVIEMDGAVDLPPDRRANAGSPLAGSLAAIRVDRGQPVKAGDVLAELVSLELQSLQLDLLKAHLAGQLLEDTFQRLKPLGDVVPRRRVLELESEVNANRQMRDTLERKLRVVGLSSDQLKSLLADRKLVESLPIRSPIDGVVVSFDRVLGQAIKIDEPLFAVHDLGRPLIQGHVSEREVGRVHLGQPVWVRLRSDPSFVGEGRVVRSGRTFGTASRSLAVWVELKEPPPRPLLLGQLARLTLTVGRSAPTPAVPLEAVVSEGTRSFVFVGIDNGTFERRAVVLGRSDDRRVEVVQGLRLKERVAVRGAGELQTAYAAVE